MRKMCIHVSFFVYFLRIVCRVWACVLCIDITFTYRAVSISVDAHKIEYRKSTSTHHGPVWIGLLEI